MVCTAMRKRKRLCRSGQKLAEARVAAAEAKVAEITKKGVVEAVSVEVH
jgi:hypothetical protein